MGSEAGFGCLRMLLFDSSLDAIIGGAEQIVEQLTLTVVQGNNAALSLYEKYGFRAYGVEPRALKTAAGYSDEILMSRIL